MLTRQEAIEVLTGAGQPLALETIVVGGRTIRNFAHAPASLRAMFLETATDRPFIVYDDERLTFREAWDAASRIGHVLAHRYGVARGDRVAIAMRNYPEWILAFTAIVSIGGIAVAMNAHWQADEMAYGLTDCGAKVLIADRERLERLARCPPDPGLAVIAVRCPDLPHGGTAWSELMAAAGDVPMPPVAIAADDPATIIYTSGSTGHPKGVVSTHRNILAALLSWELDRRVGELVAGDGIAIDADRPGTLLAVPLFHVSGSHASYLACYRQQRRLACMYRWDPHVAAALIERERLTSMIAPAAMTGDLLREARSGKYDLSSLLLLGGGGAPRAPEQVRQIDASFDRAQPLTGWGMTETNAIGSGIGGDDYLHRPASSGRCSVVMELKVVDDRGAEVPAGQRGELLVRGAALFSGYWNRPSLNAEVFEDGWFRTGDVALLDDEGFLFIVDRIKDLIIRGGENIGCGQVEAAILQHPDVYETTVYAVPDERLGEEVGATVYGSGRLDLDALRAFLAGHLARFEIPRYLFKADAPLPRTASGKLHKRAVREAALAALARGGAGA